MLNRLFFILYFILGILIFVSCNKGKQKNQQLLRAEALMTSFPDSSYFILQGIALNNLSKDEQMYYGLLLAKVSDKNNLSLLACDSLINEAIRYYTNDGINYAKALMYKERIQHQSGMNKEAIEYCFMALNELGDVDKKEEQQIKGMIYEDLGNIYVSQLLVKEAMEMFVHAKECFWRCGYKDGIASTMSNMGWNYLLEGDTASARDYMKQDLMYVLERQDSVAISVAYHNLSCTYEDTDSIVFYAKLSLAFDDKTSLKAAIMLGYSFINKGQIDSAQYYFHQALTDTMMEKRALAFYGLKDVMEESEEFQKAAEYWGDYSAIMDSIYFMKTDSEIKKKVYEHKVEMKVYKERIRMKIWLFSLIISCLLIILFSVLGILWMKRRKDMLQLGHERDMAELQYHIASLRCEQEKDKEAISQKEREIRRISDEKAKLCNLIFEKTAIYKEIAKLALQKNGSKKQEIRVLIEEQQKILRSTIANIYKDYIAYLNEAYPKYTEDDCLFSCLSLCGWDDFTIALCFGNSDKRIVIQRRYRMKMRSSD